MSKQLNNVSRFFPIDYGKAAQMIFARSRYSIITQMTNEDEKLPIEAKVWLDEKIKSQPNEKARKKRILTEQLDRILKLNPITSQNILNNMGVEVDCDRTSYDYSDPYGLGVKED